MRQGLGRYAVSSIGNSNFYFFVVLLDRDGYVSLIGIFDGIRHQIINHDGDNLLVVPHLNHVLRCHELDVQRVLTVQLFVFQANLLHGFHNISLCHA